MIGKRAVFAALAAVVGSAPAHAAVVISTAATENMNCAGGTCEPTAQKAVLNATDLGNYLSQFGNVRVVATGNGVEANNIVVNAAFSSPDSTSLTLDAHGAITVNAAASIGSGTSELELQSGKGGTFGTLSFGRKGHITFGSLSDIFGINGGIFTLVGSVQGLASAVAANPSGAFALANNYDASQDGTYSSAPIQTTFFGSLEGLGNAISYLKIVDNLSLDSVGLFTSVGGGPVTNLRLEQINLQAHGHDMFVGGFAGTTTGGLVASVSVSGKIVTRGGHSNRNGGLVGLNAGGSIVNSVSNASVVGGEYVGGLVGQNSTGQHNSTITDSQAHGAVSSNSSGFKYVGGLVGYNAQLGSITASYATGNVLGGPGSSSGGLVGINGGDNASNLAISNSYASGAVTGGSGSSVGGFVGTNFGRIDDSYSTGPPVGEGGSLVGCFVGNDTPGDIAESYWDTTTSRCRGMAKGVTGLTSKQLRSGLPPGFDAKIWMENPNINNGLPYLIANPPPK